MANEITQTITLSATKGGATVSLSSTKRIDMTGNEMMQSTQSIGTTAETLALGDVAGVPASVAIKNLDATNYVDIGGNADLDTFYVRIRPGQTAVFQPSSGTLHAKANTAAVRVQIVAMEA